MKDESDNLIDEVFPAAIAIAHMKAEIAKQVSRQIVIEVKKSRKLTLSEEKSILRAVDEIVSRQPPRAFGMDLNWRPKSEAEVREKLVRLWDDKNFKNRLVKAILDELKSKQSKINGTA